VKRGFGVDVPDGGLNAMLGDVVVLLPDDEEGGSC